MLRFCLEDRFEKCAEPRFHTRTTRTIRTTCCASAGSPRRSAAKRANVALRPVNPARRTWLCQDITKEEKGLENDDNKIRRQVADTRNL